METRDRGIAGRIDDGLAATKDPTLEPRADLTPSTESEPEGRPSCILITDADSRPALAATRSLALAGYRVEVLTCVQFSRAGSSRFASDVHSVANPSDDPKAWSQDVKRLLDRQTGQLLIPITEVALGNLFASGLDKRVDTLTPNPDAYRKLTDKADLMDRAESLGIDVPKGLLIEDPSSINGLPDGFQFPVVLKPKTSRWLAAGHWRQGDVRIARNPAMLTQHLADPGMSNGFLLQEFIPGHGESVCLLADHGDTRAAFSHRRLRERPPSGGVSVLCESREPDPELQAASEKLLDSVHWDGIAMVEFRREPSGRAVLMEVNPRFWGSLQLAIDAGIDFPRLAVQLNSGEDFPKPEIIEGKRLRWLLGDFDHLWMMLLRARLYPTAGRGRRRALADFFKSFFDGSKLEVLRYWDVRPMIADIIAWFR